jgi:hypothetical protein
MRRGDRRAGAGHGRGAVVRRRLRDRLQYRPRAWNVNDVLPGVTEASQVIEKGHPHAHRCTSLATIY